jgi:hypothetical protein
VDSDFDFTWQPQRYHDPKHYIFYAKNPLNGLVYGHQAAVAYHRETVLNTVDYGLDFTMSAPHDVVAVVSGVAEYNCDPVVTWRTAFREVIKLQHCGDAESMERLNIWLTVANGQHSEFSLLGARQGIEFYDNVCGNPIELQRSFSWSWLNEYWDKYNSHLR